MKRKFTVFAHQQVKIIPITQSILSDLGDSPNVQVLLYDENGKLTKQEVPVEYILDETDILIKISVTTSNKNGIIILS